MALSDVKVRTAKPEAKAYKLTDGEGMVLLIHPNGSKYWRLRYRFGGKEKMLALGRYPEVSLADARGRRDEASKLIANGIDPSENKKAVKVEQEQEAITFEVVAREWHASNQKWSASHSARVLKSLEDKPTQNAFIERFNRTYRTEILDFYLFRTLNEAREITERWLKEYNNERPHESLNNLTPEEYRLMAETTDISKSSWN